MIVRILCRGTSMELKKNLLRRKYCLLMTILTKSILGEQSSHDGLSKPRLCCMRAILNGVKVDWFGLLLVRLKEVKLRFTFNASTREWSPLIVASIFNKITMIIEGLNVDVDWSMGVKKYSKQKGILVKDERIGGLPDSDNESDEPREQRRQIEEVAARRPAVAVPT